MTGSDRNKPLDFPSSSGEENRLPDDLYEDTGNYGRGGYYGSTYDQTFFSRERNRMLGDWGRPDDYRQLGDRRWSDERLPWEKERISRTGYRSIRDRVETAKHRWTRKR